MWNLAHQSRPNLAITMVCGLFLLPCAVATAQQPTLHDPLLDKMIGKWVLRGTITGKPTTHDIDIRWVLNHQFIEIHEVSRERDAKGSPQYEAWVFLGWDSSKSRYVAHWIDVFGGGFSLRGYAPKEENSIPMIFESEDGKFHTTFRYDQNTSAWSWTMDNEQNGSLREFARLKMVRRK